MDSRNDSLYSSLLEGWSITDAKEGRRISESSTATRNETLDLWRDVLMPDPIADGGDDDPTDIVDDPENTYAGDRLKPPAESIVVDGWNGRTSPASGRPNARLAGTAMLAAVHVAFTRLEMLMGGQAIVLRTKVRVLDVLKETTPPIDRTESYAKFYDEWIDAFLRATRPDSTRDVPAIERAIVSGDPRLPFILRLVRIREHLAETKGSGKKFGAPGGFVSSRRLSTENVADIGRWSPIGQKRALTLHGTPSTTSTFRILSKGVDVSELGVDVSFSPGGNSVLLDLPPRGEEYDLSVEAIDSGGKIVGRGRAGKLRLAEMATCVRDSAFVDFADSAKRVPGECEWDVTGEGEGAGRVRYIGVHSLESREPDRAERNGRFVPGTIRWGARTQMTRIIDATEDLDASEKVVLWNDLLDGKPGRSIAPVRPPPPKAPKAKIRLSLERLWEKIDLAVEADHIQSILRDAGRISSEAEISLKLFEEMIGIFAEMSDFFEKAIEKTKRLEREGVFDVREPLESMEKDLKNAEDGLIALGNVIGTYEEREKSVDEAIADLNSKIASWRVDGWPSNVDLALNPFESIANLEIESDISETKELGVPLLKLVEDARAEAAKASERSVEELLENLKETEDVVERMRIVFELKARDPRTEIPNEASIVEEFSNAYVKRIRDVVEFVSVRGANEILSKRTFDALLAAGNVPSGIVSSPRGRSPYDVVARTVLSAMELRRPDVDLDALREIGDDLAADIAERSRSLEAVIEFAKAASTAYGWVLDNEFENESKDLLDAIEHGDFVDAIEFGNLDDILSCEDDPTDSRNELVRTQFPRFFRSDRVRARILEILRSDDYSKDDCLEKVFRSLGLKMTLEEKDLVEGASGEKISSVDYFWVYLRAKRIGFASTTEIDEIVERNGRVARTFFEKKTFFYRHWFENSPKYARLLWMMEGGEGISPGASAAGKIFRLPKSDLNGINWNLKSAASSCAYDVVLIAIVRLLPDLLHEILTGEERGPLGKIVRESVLSVIGYATEGSDRPNVGTDLRERLTKYARDLEIPIDDPIDQLIRDSVFTSKGKETQHGHADTLLVAVKMLYGFDMYGFDVLPLAQGILTDERIVSILDDPRGFEADDPFVFILGQSLEEPVFKGKVLPTILGSGSKAVRLVGKLRFNRAPDDSRASHWYISFLDREGTWRADDALSTIVPDPPTDDVFGLIYSKHRVV